MLVKAHTPERKNVAFTVAVDIGKLFKFLFEILECFIRIALGEICHEIKGVSGTPPIVFLK